MRIVVWGINYSPELIGIAPCNAAMCEFLAKNGCQVTMLTTFPYYPAWKKRAIDRGRILHRETINGVRILRCWHHVPRRVSTMWRVLHELSFAVHSLARLMFMQRPDALIVISPPLLAGAVQLTCAVSSPGIALTFVGLKGVPGTTAFEAVDAGPGPPAFTATTRNV